MNISRRSTMLTGTAFLAGGCTATKPFNAPKWGWSTATSLPLALQEIYPAAHQGRIHQAGGFIATNGQISNPTNEHFSWAPGESMWRNETPLPRARHHPQLISFKGQLLALAGFESRDTQTVWMMQKSGWVLNTDNQWEDAPELPAPCGEAVLGVTEDGVLHLAGGRTPIGSANAAWQDQGDTSHHYMLHDIEGNWERAAPCPTKRNSATGAVIESKLHIVGGRQVGAGNLATHEIYDSKEDRWRNASPMPQAQGGLAAAALGGKLYVFGGEYFDSGGGVYPESWVYNPKQDNWTALPDMPTPRHGLGAVTLGKDIYVIGGAKEAGGNQTSAIVERFRP